ncbi:kinase-like domain-containing protein [Mycotypha africana]|uniref:kinase-like domain-containing protein n=1 Tax=Mycotypha africana TaxID=64632 RepID=UPI0023015643|nr:kinase-like domain-containing protein [Mycotypha africana]KAI8988348.1 kinase-like domain-containing protein [Mycotypha africana]
MVEGDRQSEKKVNYCIRDDESKETSDQPCRDLQRIIEWRPDREVHRTTTAAPPGQTVKPRKTAQPTSLESVLVRDHDGNYQYLKNDRWGCIVKNDSMIYPLVKNLSNRCQNEAAGYYVGTDDVCDIKLFMDPERYPDLADNPRFQFLKPEGRFFMPTKPSSPVKLIHCLYRIKQKLSTGAFGDVLSAECKMTHKQVVIKIIPDQVPHSQQQQQPLRINKETKKKPRQPKFYLREMSVCLSLPYHPCIIQINRVFESNNKIYIVMEYGKDGDLFETVLKSFLEEDQVKIVFDQIAHAVAFLHDKGIVHRDLKLENIILCNREQLKVKVCDFGISNFIQDGKHLETSCGTINYAAPELLTTPRSYGAEVDIWSLGVLLYTALASNTPFMQISSIDNLEERAKLKEQIRTGNYNFHHPVWRGISAEAKDLIQHMLDINRDTRYTIQDVLRHPWLQQLEVMDVITMNKVAIC